MPLAPPAQSAANAPEKPTPAPLPHISGEFRSGKPPRSTKSRGRRQPPLRPSHRTTIQSPKCASSSGSRWLKLKFQILQIFAKVAAQLIVLQRDFDGRFQESQFVARIIGYAFIDVRPKTVLLGQEAQRVRQLNFISSTRLGALQAIENLWRQDIAPGDGQVGRSIRRFRFFHQVTNPQKPRTERRQRRGLPVDDAIKMGFFPRHFLHRNSANTSGRVHIDQLPGGGVFSRNQYVSQQNRERLVAHKILGHQHGVSQPERLLLPRVAHLDHVADSPDHGSLILLPSFLQEALQHGRMVEMIFNRVFALSRHDDDVFDARGNTLFHHVLDLWFVYYRQHLFGLRFGRGQEARAKPCSRQNGLANFAYRVRWWWCISHAFPRRTYFFLVDFFSFVELSLELVSFAGASLPPAFFAPPSFAEPSFAPASFPPPSLPSAAAMLSLLPPSVDLPA